MLTAKINQKTSVQEKHQNVHDGQINEDGIDKILIILCKKSEVQLMCSVTQELQQ